ncbi:MAG: hypothetical protein M3394_01480 [Actinomycetota bacterium]|nr:hypothetical protein [Actinomycetota bacterium]
MGIAPAAVELEWEALDSELVKGGMPENDRRRVRRLLLPLLAFEEAQALVAAGDRDQAIAVLDTLLATSAPE